MTARTPTLLGQTLITFAGNSGGYLVAIVTGIVVARTLGPAGKGVASYAALVMALCTTFGSGLQSAVLSACGRSGHAQAAVYGATIRLMGLGFVPVAVALVTIAVREPRYAALAYVACAIPFAVYCQIASSIFLLNNDVRTTVVAGTIPTFGVALLTIPALTIFHGGLTSVLAIWAAMFAASACYVMVRLGRYLPPLRLAASAGLMREEAPFALKSGAAALASFLNLRVDVFVVSVMLDARTLGIYTLAVATGELMWQVSRPLVWSTTARIAAAERDRAIDLTCAVSRHVLAVEFGLGIAIFILAPLAVRLVYGSAYAESATVVRWLLPGLVLYAAQAPLSFFILVKEGKPAMTLVIQCASVIACAAISVLTIARFGLLGAALATTITYACATLASGVLFARYTGATPSAFLVVNGSDLRRIRHLIARAMPAAAVADRTGAAS
jgi:O-antigen/teichoic acid export membrane protein